MLYCRFCNRTCKNRNSLAQHEIRCKNNPDKISTQIAGFNNIGRTAWNKGLTKDKSVVLQKQALAISSTLKNRSIVSSIWEEHNKLEIDKWLNYIDSLDIAIPAYETRIKQGYKILKGNSHAHCNGTHYIFEHHYLISLVLSNLPEGSIIHHIDEDKLNNNLHNLLVFDSYASHARFHKSEYAYITYDTDTHMFNVSIKPI